MINLTTHGLPRFVEAQDRVFDSVCNELALGEKNTHWMWFIFPQLQGLGKSAVARHYAIKSMDEALAYWQNPVLGPRLVTCVKLVLAQPNTTARDVFGTPDDLKFKSCLTLFGQVAPREPVFKQALDRFFAGKADEATLRLLA